MDVAIGVYDGINDLPPLPADPEYVKTLEQQVIELKAQLEILKESKDAVD